MPDPITTDKVLEIYDGNDSAVTEYPITLQWADDDDLHLLVGGVETGAFTVTPTGFTTTAPVASGTALILYRTTPRTQILPFPNNTTPSPADVKSAVNKLTLMVQEIAAGRDIPVKSITFPLGEDPTFDTALPAAADRLNKYIHFNSLTGEMELVESEIEEAAAASAIAADASADAAAASAIAADASADAAAASAIAADASADAAAASAIAADASADAAAAITIVDDSVTNAKLSNMTQATIKGRATGAGTGDPTDLTPAQAKAIIYPTGIPDEEIGNGIVSVYSDAGFVSPFTLSDGGTVILAHTTLTMPASPLRGIQVGSKFVWDITIHKTASNTGNFRIKIFRGLTGVWSTDTNDVTATLGLQTAVVDTMRFRVTVYVGTAGASGDYYYKIDALHDAASGTGFGLVTGSGGMFTGAVSGVALDTASLKFSIGIQSFSGGGAGATFHVGTVLAQAFNVC